LLRFRSYKTHASAAVFICIREGTLMSKFCASQ
jgi:hypothetical protein